MTQEQRHLLLVDLCARLPYGVIVKVSKEDNGSIKSDNKPFDVEIYNLLLLNGWYKERGIVYHYSQFSLKPYLRPISSMTEEEIKGYHKYTDSEHRECYEVRANGEDRKTILEQDSYSSAMDLDWLNVHHFDYRGLIPMGLALEAPEDMYT